MKSGSRTCKDANQIDLVDFLSGMHHEPVKVRGNDYWYLSPLRSEKTASFKVNRKLNVWYDHGIGKGGNLVDFGTEYFKCSVSDLLSRLWHDSEQNFSFHQRNFADEKKEDSGKKIEVINERILTDRSLLEYLNERYVPIAVAQQFCSEVDFNLRDKKYTAIGFKNDSGGFELRSKHFKGSSSPKAMTFIDNGSNDVSVFEGFFSYLSFHSFKQNVDVTLTNFLVLNSLSFFEKAKEKMERHDKIFMYLDHDDSGLKCTRQAILSNNKYVDRSFFYEGHKDLNDLLIHKANRLKRGLRSGRHF